jgi:hypothetical protein
MKTSGIVTFCYLRSQGIKLLRWRLGHVPCGNQLPLANAVHDFNPRKRTPGRPKRFKAEHRMSDPFHSSVILFHDIIEIFAVADDDSRLVGPVVMFDRGCVRATLVNVIFSGSCWLRIALRRKASAAALSRCGVNKKSTGCPSLSLPKPGCHHPGSAPKPCMTVGPSHGSSVICPLT